VQKLTPKLACPGRFSYNKCQVDQREIVKKLEEYFREENRAHYHQRKKVHESRESLTDEEWWDELIERTKSIRPQMLSIFERNKEEMISKRFQTIDSEEGFREKAIQRQVMELLPHISSVRSEMGESDLLTEDQIRLAKLRQTANSESDGVRRSIIARGKDDLDQLEDFGGEVESDFIQTMIESQLQRREELN
jgi:hypothetical protein